MTPPQILLPDGRVATVKESDGEHTIIESPASSPPGSVVRGRIDGIAVDFQLKVRNCRKDGDLFSIDGRMQNATREMKQALKGS